MKIKLKHKKDSIQFFINLSFTKNFFEYNKYFSESFSKYAH